MQNRVGTAVHLAPGLVTAGSQSLPSSGFAAGAPALRSSLIHLTDSSLTVSASSISNNTAAALITAAGGSPNSIQLLQGTSISHNRAAWLVVMDAEAADAVGRQLLRAAAGFTDPATHHVPEAVRSLPVSLYNFTERLPHLFGRYQMHRWHSHNSSGSNDVPPWAASDQLSDLMQLVPEQRPLSLLVRDSSIVGNNVTWGCFWLRLVNTTMLDTSVRQNTANRLDGLSFPCQQGPPCRSAHALCDVGALQLALLQFQGASGLLINRCKFIGNTYSSGGGLLRAADTLALAGIQHSIFQDNNVSLLVRFEGRGWIINATSLLHAEEYTQVIAFSEYQDRTKAAYERTLATRSERRGMFHQAMVVSPWYIHHCNITHNTVTHSLIMTAGNATSYRDFYGGREPAYSHNATFFAVTSSIVMHNQLRRIWHSDTELDMLGMMALLPVALHANLTHLAANPSEGTVSTCKAAVSFALAQHRRNAAPLDRTHLPSVLIANNGVGCLSNNMISQNIGFAHVLLLHHVWVTLVDLTVERHITSRATVTTWYSSLWVHGLTMAGNTGAGILDLKACEPYFEHVQLTGNHVRHCSSNSKLSCMVPSPQQQQQMSSNCQEDWQSSSHPVFGLEGLSAIILQHINITGSSGCCSVALKVQGYFFAGPAAHLHVANNSCAGVELWDYSGKYESEVFELQHLTVEHNCYHPKSMVGGLMLGGLHYGKIGANRFVRLSHLTLRNNTPCSAGGYPKVAFSQGVGGGLLLQGFQRSANWASRFSTHLINTTVEDNVARSGGGIACVNCRAILINTVLRMNAAQDDTVTTACKGAYSSHPDSPSNCAQLTAADTMGSELPDRYVEGAGGGIAALMDRENSFITMLCGSSMANNSADWVGVAVFLDYKVADGVSQQSDVFISTQSAIGIEPSWHCGSNLAASLFSGSTPPDGISMSQDPAEVLELHSNASLLGGQLIAWNGSHCVFLPASTATARLEHLILQTTHKPRFNSRNDFTLKLVHPHSLLRHVKYMTVEVEVLRCTTGQFELDNQCVNCRGNGTFSLNPLPYSNNIKTCRPCVDGFGNCIGGLMVPDIESYMPNPFVPQLLKCPLKGACQALPKRFQQLLQLQQAPDANTSISFAGGIPPPMQSNIFDISGTHLSSDDIARSFAATMTAVPVGLSDRAALLDRFQDWLSHLVTSSSYTGGKLISYDTQHALVKYWQGLQCSDG
eukprot:gene8326-8511_t